MSRRTDGKLQDVEGTYRNRDPSNLRFILSCMGVRLLSAGAAGAALVEGSSSCMTTVFLLELASDFLLAATGLGAEAVSLDDDAAAAASRSFF